MAFWGSQATGTCGPNCVFVGPTPDDQQTEFKTGARGSAALYFYFREGGRGAGFGLQTAYTALPAHSASGIPLRHWSLGVLILVRR